MTHAAVSDLKLATEDEFLRRELGLHIKYGHSDLLYDESFCIIVTDRPSNWKLLLSSAPRKSLIVFLIGNETYEPWKYEFFNDFDSVLHLFIYNPPSNCTNSNLAKSLLGHILDGGLKRTSSPGSVFRDFRTSQYTKKKLSRIKIKKDFSELPQGYSNSFVRQLQMLSQEVHDYLTTRDSLYSQNLTDLLSHFTKKDLEFSYLAQETNHRRAVCARVAHSKFGVETRNKKGFGGLYFDGDNTYLKLLLRTKFPLVPPGLFNNYNHRYSETLLTGGIPAILAQNSLDPSVNHNWTNNLKFPKGHSFLYLLNYLRKLTNSEFTLLQKKIFDSDFSRIMELRVRFKSLL